jgi:hypothetical protein
MPPKATMPSRILPEELPVSGFDEFIQHLYTKDSLQETQISPQNCVALRRYAALEPEEDAFLKRNANGTHTAKRIERKRKSST